MSTLFAVDVYVGAVPAAHEIPVLPIFQVIVRAVPSPTNSNENPTAFAFALSGMFDRVSPVQATVSFVRNT